MTLKELFDKYGVSDDTEKLRIAYLLASFGALYTNDEQEEEIEVDDLTSYDLDDLYVSDYDIESGCYGSNRVWFSLDSVIRALVGFKQDYD